MIVFHPGLNKTETFYLSNTTILFRSLYGRICYILFIFVRHILSLTLEIIFQIISIRSFRKYVINKGLLLNARPSLLAARNQNEPMNHAKTDEKRHHKMVIFLTFISIFHKTVFLAYTFYTMFFGLSILCLFINSYSIILKHWSNFFLFHFLIRNFVMN